MLQLIVRKKVLCKEKFLYVNISKCNVISRGCMYRSFSCIILGFTHIDATSKEKYDENDSQEGSDDGKPHLQINIRGLWRSRHYDNRLCVVCVGGSVWGAVCVCVCAVSEFTHCHRSLTRRLIRMTFDHRVNNIVCVCVCV